MLGLFAVTILASTAIGMGVWCASQGAKAAGFLDRGLFKAWVVFSVFAAIRTLWFFATAPERMDEAGAFLVAGTVIGFVFTVFFWAGHWRARRTTHPRSASS
ncbi:MAG: hypothetical protein AAF291_08885 [Pseudomonadota bacterium]